MNIKELQKNWNEFGEIDPLWAILTQPDKKDNKWKIEEFFKTGGQDLNDVIKYVETLGVNITYGKALDFGCGVGRLTQALSHHFKEVIGIDIAPSMIDLAEKYNRYGDKCKYYVNETDDLRLFSDNYFDFILTLITLQHIEPQYSENYVKEFLRVLAPNGLLIFQLHSEPIASLTKDNFIKRLKKSVKAKAREIMLYVGRLNKMKTRKQPIMEIYGIKKEEVIRILSENRAKIIDVTPVDKIPTERERETNAKWKSFIYCVTKE